MVQTPKGGGEIDINTARQKFNQYMEIKLARTAETDFVVFNRNDLQKWIDALPEKAAQILVYFGGESGELDVMFWPYDAYNQKLRDPAGKDVMGYNIGDRHPAIPYESL